MQDYYTEGAAEYVAILFPRDFKGICVDIGAYAPLWLSNSWLFEEKGWEVYCIEPNPACIADLKKKRKNVIEYACGDVNKDDADFFVFTANKEVGEAAGTGLINHCEGVSAQFHLDIFTRTDKVKVRTLDYLMENEIKKDHIDFLSIDVERNEMAVLSGTSLSKWQPKVIAIENLEKDQEQITYLTDHDYRYVHRIMYNDFYVLNSYYLEIVANNSWFKNEQETWDYYYNVTTK